MLQDYRGANMTKFERMHYALSIAFARGILDGEQLAELLAIYRGQK
jgi:hypothetical protein